jgi:hypothetical protein
MAPPVASKPEPRTFQRDIYFRTAVGTVVGVALMSLIQAWIQAPIDASWLAAHAVDPVDRDPNLVDIYVELVCRGIGGLAQCSPRWLGWFFVIQILQIATAGAVLAMAFASSWRRPRRPRGPTQIDNLLIAILRLTVIIPIVLGETFAASGYYVNLMYGVTRLRESSPIPALGVAAVAALCVAVAPTLQMFICKEAWIKHPPTRA